MNTFQLSQDDRAVSRQLLSFGVRPWSAPARGRFVTQALSNTEFGGNKQQKAQVLGPALFLFATFHRGSSARALVS